MLLFDWLCFLTRTRRRSSQKSIRRRKPDSHQRRAESLEERILLTIVAGDDSYSIEEDSSAVALPVLANDDLDGGYSSYVDLAVTSPPTNGSAWSDWDNTTYNQVIAYSPGIGFTGSDSLTYQVDDYSSGYSYPGSGSGGNSGSGGDSADVAIDVHPVDNTLSDARLVNAVTNTAITVAGYSGDGPQSWSDADLFEVSLTAGEVLHLDIDAAYADDYGYEVGLDSYLRVFDASGTEVANNDNGIDPVTGAFGNDSVLSVSVTTTGTYYIGVSDSSYTSYDPTTSGYGYSSTSGPYTLTILREASTSPPVAVDDSVNVHAGDTLEIDVLVNDYDPDNDPLSISTVTVPTNGSASVVTDGNGTHIDYTPDAGFFGSDSFTYTISDGINDATATVQVNVDNVAPIGVADELQALTDQPLSITSAFLLSNDSDADQDGLSVVLDAMPQNGTLTVESDGSFTYESFTSFSGTDNFTYFANDGTQNSQPVTVTIEVHAFPLIASDDSGSVGRNKTLLQDAPGVLDNDWDFDGDVLTVALASGPANGTVQLLADGSYTYTPDNNYVGIDSFTYSASDNFGNSDTATVSISITNTAPWAVDDFYTVSHDRVFDNTSGVLWNDTDLEGDDLTVTLGTSVTNGTLTLAADGTFVYTPNAGFLGTDTFTYTVLDDVNSGNTVTASIEVKNSRAVATADTFYIPVDGSRDLTAAELLANDFDADLDALSILIQQPPSNGQLTQTGDVFTYAPAAGFSGFDTFTYVADDGLAVSDPVVVTLKVNNARPIGVIDFATGPHDQSLSGNVLANDIDDDADQLFATLETAPGSGVLTLSANGDFQFQPDLNFTGEVTFTYFADDNVEQSTPVTVTLNITNAAPTGLADAFQIHQGITLQADAASGVLANDFDADGDSLQAVLISGPVNGSLNFNSDGSFDYVPNGGFTGTDSFSYSASDGVAPGLSTVVDIDVGNWRPTASSDQYSLKHDRTLTTTLSNGLLANDFDIDDDQLQVVLVTDVTTGTLTLNSDGTFTYVPPGQYTGTVGFDYLVNDGAEDSLVVTATINVTNTQPWASNRSFAVHQGQTLGDNEASLFAFSGDRESDVLTLSIEKQPDHGVLTVNPDGTFTYIPHGGFVGEDYFHYQLHDSVDDSLVTAVSISVTNVDPVAFDDSYTVSHDRPLHVSHQDGLLANDFDVDDFLMASPVSYVTTQLGPTQVGVGVTDNATGTSYLMFSEESVHTRFTEVYSGNSNHVIAVQNLGPNQWFYNNNNQWQSFSPTVSVHGSF